MTITEEDDKHHKRDRQTKQGWRLLAICLFGLFAIITFEAWKASSNGKYKFPFFHRFRGYHGHGHGIIEPPSSKLRKKIATLLKDSGAADVTKLPLNQNQHHHQQGGAIKRAEERMHLDRLSNRRGLHEKRAARHGRPQTFY